MSRERELARTTLQAARAGAPVPLDAADPREWAALDSGVRLHLMREELPTAWLHAGEPAPGDAAFAIALCHASGHVREAALRHPGAAALLSLVILRCADWAGPVRERARTLLDRALPAAAPETVALGTAVALRAAGRKHGAHARDLLAEHVRSPGLIDALLASPDRDARRFGHRAAIEQDHLSPARLVRIAATDRDAVVQDLCADAALARAQDGEVLRPLLATRHPRVRAAGVTALKRTGDTDEAARFLTDRSGLVRACARWVLRQHGIDPLPLHRAACTGPDVLPGAPTGLGECGTRADTALLWPLLDHPRPAVRANAVAALRALGTSEQERFTPLLDDPSASVVREATTALEPVAARLPEEWLYERLADDRPRHVRVSAFRLLTAHRPAARLRCLRRLVDDPDPKLRVRALTALAAHGPAHETPPDAERGEPGTQPVGLFRRLFGASR
ncbi:HEAT repeat domain-containing protein [Streptomyces sp. AV19]|uniref:HEAT repeat domain-containing protein n=1 Tax=Streptomyces sp. AV19 TaxID=2793068 RepID=UPI0018FEF936|nr:HEAT repeat domain-containing protein [Streptomyces sp. AV19]MBH1936770.1 HEAT repeat domain-containing protein [Streptomyces sp. AV19]MDG4532825.1 HEAT repeat domain-containing protein [Streptomyces sp. AV19]